MTLRTALIIDGDSARGQQALREFEASLEGAERATAELGQEGVKASVGLERLRVAQEQAAAAGIKLTAEQQRAAMHGREFMVQQVATAQQLQRTTASTAAQRQGMQQLSFQIGDVATMFAMGARPMQIFASQGGQIVQAIGMMRGSAGGLVGFLGGPWGIAISAAAIALTPLIQQLFDTTDAADEMKTALQEALEAFYRTMPQASALSNVMTEATRQRVAALGEIGRIDREIATIEERALTSGRGYLRQGSPAFNQIARLREQRARREAQLETADAGVASAVRAAQLRARQERLNEEATDRGTRSTRASAGAIRMRTAAISEEERARQQANKETERYIVSLEDEIAKIGLDAAGLRQLEVARQRDAAQTDDQKQRIDDLNRSREQALALEEAKKRAGEIGQENAGLGGEIAAIEREAQAIGLVGWERERLLLQLEREAQIRPLLRQLADAEAQGQSDVADQLRRQIDLLNEKYGLQIQIGAEEDRLGREREAAEELAAAYRDLGQAGYGALSDIVLRGEDAADVMQRLALSIADAALEALLLGSGPLASVFGGGGGGGLLGSLFGSIFGGGRASGGPVSPGKFYAVNEKSTAPGLFIPLMPGRIEPAGNDNSSGLGRTIVELRVRRGEMFEAEVESISGNVAVRAVQEAAPTLVEVSAAETARRLARPRI